MNNQNTTLTSSESMANVMDGRPYGQDTEAQESDSAIQEFTDKAEEVIEASESPSVGTKLYEINEPFEVEFNARPSAPRPVMVTHKLRRPTFDELYARETKTTYRTRDMGHDEEEVLPSGEDANVYLYDRVIQEVSGGYNEAKLINFAALEGDRAARKKELERIPATHKNTVIGAIYAFESEIEYSDSDLDNFIWGEEGQTYKIKTEIGLNPDIVDFTIYHTLAEPTEGQLLAFNRDRAKIIIERGTKRPVSKVMTNLRASVKLYDTLVKQVEGMTFDAQPLDVANMNHLKSIDPIMKQSVVNALIKSVQLDLGK